MNALKDEEVVSDAKTETDTDLLTERLGKRKLGWPKGVLRGSPLRRKSTRGPGRPPKVRLVLLIH